jgi:trehalose 6-phosphate phosphatase
VRRLSDDWAALSARAPGIVWALDWDGTLVDLAPHPAQVRIPPELPGLLWRLAREPRYRVVVVTGRRSDDLLAILGRGFPGVVVGNHGAELLEPVARPPAAWRREWEQIAARYPGAWIEDKGPSIAFHWRRATDRRGVERELLRFQRTAWHPDYVLLPGRFILDARPRSATKGAALEAYLAGVGGRGALPGWGVVAVGDDTTDDDLFRTARAHRGLAVLVGPRSSLLATHRLPTPAAVRRWLGAALKEAANARRPPRGPSGRTPRTASGVETSGGPPAPAYSRLGRSSGTQTTSRRHRSPRHAPRG